MWDQLRTSIEIWLSDATETLNEWGNVKELSDSALREQIDTVRELSSKIGPWKEEVERFNSRSNQLLDEHRRDDGHNVSHMASRLNTQWTKFNEALMIRRAMLDAAEKTRQDFHSSLKIFEDWLKIQCGKMSSLERYSLGNDSSLSVPQLSPICFAEKLTTHNV